jgi:hypothetical protein
MIPPSQEVQEFERGQSNASRDRLYIQQNDRERAKLLPNLTPMQVRWTAALLPVMWAAQRAIKFYKVNPRG